jgi:glycerate dehydrogenase
LKNKANKVGVVLVDCHKGNPKIVNYAFKNKRMKIVVLDGYTLNPGDLSWDGLKEFGEVVVYDRTPQDKVVERAKDAEIIFTNKTVIDEAVLNSLPKLKYIGVLATGYNVVDTETARSKNVTVTNVPGYSTASVAQMTFALLLELTQHVQRHSDTVVDGKWAHSPYYCYWDYPLMELAGKTMGIIGYGTIGKKVGEIASAFGMNIIGSKRVQHDMSHLENFRWAEIPELLEQSDVVSIHCPLTPETKGMINRESLQLMKRSAFLINTSRGPIMVDEDLADALNHDVIAGAGLDVLTVEPPQLDNPLFKAKNCVITPHIAWATIEARGRLMDLTVSNLAAFLSGKPVNVVN